LDDFKLDPARDHQPTILDQSRLKTIAHRSDGI